MIWVCTVCPGISVQKLRIITIVLSFGIPTYKKNIDNLEKVQFQAVRFITGYYTSRNQGCVSQMWTELNLPSLQDRRKSSRQVFFFKVVEGLVPLIQSHDFLTSVQGNRLIKSKLYTNCVTSEILSGDNPPITVNVLRLHSVILKFTRTHSFWGLLIGTIWMTVLCVLIQLTAFLVDHLTVGLVFSPSSLPVVSALKGPAMYSFR